MPGSFSTPFARFAFLLPLCFCGNILPGADLPGPVIQKGLLFAVTEDRANPVTLNKSDGTPFFEMYYDITPSGLAIFDKHRMLRLEGGGFRADKTAPLFVEAIQKSSQFSLEARIVPELENQDGIVIALASDQGSCFELVQAGKELLFQWSTSSGGTNRLKVADLRAKSAVEFIITADSGVMTLYLDGKKSNTIPFQGDFSAWKPGILFFGNDREGKRPWIGKIDAPALYSQALSAADALRSASARAALVGSRATPPQLRIQATLTKMSKFEQPGTIPYKRAYATAEYAVNRVLEGKYEGKRICVAQWVFVDNKLLSNSQLQVGKTCDLRLEPFEANPQMASEVAFDDMPPELSLDLWYDVSRLQPAAASR